MLVVGSPRRAPWGARAVRWLAPALAAVAAAVVLLLLHGAPAGASPNPVTPPPTVGTALASAAVPVAGSVGGTVGRAVEPVAATVAPVADRVVTPAAAVVAP